MRVLSSSIAIVCSAGARRLRARLADCATCVVERKPSFVRSRSTSCCLRSAPPSPRLVELCGAVVELDLAKHLAGLDAIAFLEMERLHDAIDFGFHIDGVQRLGAAAHGDGRIAVGHAASVRTCTRGTSSALACACVLSADSGSAEDTRADPQTPDDENRERGAIGRIQAAQNSADARPQSRSRRSNCEVHCMCPCSLRGLAACALRLARDSARRKFNIAM